MSGTLKNLGLVKELPAKCVHVSINQVIGASTFWALESCSSDEVKRIEETLMREFKLHREGCNFLPEEEEMVSVKNPESGRCCRGIVMNVLQTTKGFKYTVFLVDHGIPLSVSNSYIRQIPPALLRPQWQSYQIELFGIVPTSVDMNFDKDKCERIVTSEWTEAAVCFVNSTIKRHKTGYFQPRLGKGQNKQFGELYLPETEGYVNLGNLLVEMEFAVRDETLFRELADAEYLYIKRYGSKSWLVSDVQPCLDSSLIQKKWSIIQNYIQRCQTNPNSEHEETKRKQIEEWREHGRKALENEMVNTDLGRGHTQEASPKTISNNSVPRRNDLLDLLSSLKKSDCSSSRSSDIADDIEPVTTKTPVTPVTTHVKPVKTPTLLDLVYQDKKTVSDSSKDDIKTSPDKCNITNGFVQVKTLKQESEISPKPKLLELCEILHKSRVKQECKSPPKQELLNQETKPLPSPKVTEQGNGSSQKPSPRSNLTLIPAGASLTTISETNSLAQRETEKHVSRGSKSPLSNHLQSTERKFSQLHETGPATEVFKNSARFDRSSSTGASSNISTSSSSSSHSANRSEHSLQTQKTQGNSDSSAPNTRQFKFLNELFKLGELQLKNNSSSPKETSARAQCMISDSDDASSVKSCEPDTVALSTFESSGLHEKPTFSTVADHLRINPVLLHGEGKNVKHVSSIAQACFPRDIHKALFRCKFIDPMRIQKYAWPLILRGENVIMVSAPRSGKTLAYMAPIVGFMLQKETYNHLPRGCGPLVLVLCSSSSSAQNAYDVCCELIAENEEKVSVVITYGGGAEREQRVQLLNGCDILISTPRCLLRLLDNEECITNLKRVAHIVFDEADVLSLKYLPEMKEILKRCYTVLSKRKEKASTMQMVAACQKWCPALKSLASAMPKSPCICIASCLEAAIYAHLQPHLHFIDNTSRASTIKDILKKQMGLYKTVVVCRTSEEVEELATILMPECDNLIAIHGNMPHFKDDDVLRKWNQSVAGCYPVLVCCDDVLYDLKLYDAMWLIHYSLPSDSKTVFGFRFSCLMNNFKDLVKNKDNDAQTPDCTVHILLDEGSTQQLPPIVHLMKRLGASISKNLEEASAEAEMKKELKKGDVPLCYNVKAFGDCWDKSSCPNRHLIKADSDSPQENFPINGTVKLKVLHVHDACNMSARLLEHTDLKGNTKPIPNQFISICFKLNGHYKDANNRIAHGIPKIKDICAVEYVLNVFQRAQVLAITKVNANGDPEEVLVQYLDHGKWEEVKVLKLLALPEDLQKLPPQVVEIYICRLSPCDLDWKWGRAVTLKVSKWLEEVNSIGESEGKYMQGQIVLSLNNTLWLDPLECRRSLSMVGTSCLVFSVRRDLLQADLAVDNPNHIINLHKLCIKSGLALPPYRLESIQKTPVHQSQKPFEAQWAFLPGEELDDVFLCTAENPGLFFVRLAKWEENLEKLKLELQKIPKKEQKGENVLKPGEFCLGRFPIDGLWYRAQVLDVEADAVNLFFVDYGDKATVQLDETASLPENMITRLPFQAIECTLVGVKPLEDDTWQEEATDVLYEATADSDDEFVKLLKVKVCKKLKPAFSTGGFRYSVILWDGTDNSSVVNQLLVNRGLAAVLEEESNLLDLAKADNRPSSETGERSVSDLNESFASTESDITSGVELESTCVTETDLQSEMESCKLDNSCTELALPNPERPENMQIATLNSASDVDVAMRFLESCEVCDPEDLMGFFDFLKLQNSKQTSEKENLGPASSPVCVKSLDKQDARPVVVAEPQEQTQEEFLPILLSTTKQPKVLWSDHNLNVTVKVMLVGVEQYYVYCDIDTLTFSTNLNGEVYLVDLDLFGVVDYRTMQHAARGQYVFFKLNKLVKGFKWDCLVKIKGTKPLWLHYDLDAKEERGAVSMLATGNKWEQQPAKGPAELSDEEFGDVDEEEEDDGLAADIVDSGDEMFDINDPLS